MSKDKEADIMEVGGFETVTIRTLDAPSVPVQRERYFPSKAERQEWLKKMAAACEARNAKSVLFVTEERILLQLDGGELAVEPLAFHAAQEARDGKPVPACLTMAIEVLANPKDVGAVLDVLDAAFLALRKIAAEEPK